MVTHPIEWDASPSKTGWKVTPPLTVRQTPPSAAATNQRFVFCSSTAMSVIRPDVRAGPSDRSSSPLKVSDEKPPFGASFSSFPGVAPLPVFARACSSFEGSFRERASGSTSALSRGAAVGVGAGVGC